MNIKRKWNMLLMFGIAAFILVISGTVQVANAYHYYMDSDCDYYCGASGDDYGQGYLTSGQGYAYSIIDPGYGVADCNCEANALSATWGAAETTADVYSRAGFWREWTWTGPPGEAPGGTLIWEIHGDGYSQTEGYNIFNSGSDTAYCTTNGLCTTGAGTQTDETYMELNTWGWVTNLTYAHCDYELDAEPINALTVTTCDVDDDNTSYIVHIVWEFDNADLEEVTAGTAYVSFGAGAICDGDSRARSTGTGMAQCYSYNKTHLFIEQASFE